MTVPSLRAAALLLALLLAACSSGPQPDTGQPDPVTYLALGDSVAAGVGAPPGQGYVELLADRLRSGLDCDDDACPLELVDLSAGGATTATVLRDQLPAAERVLRSGAAVAAVTVTAGGNDVFAPVLVGCVADPQSPRCAATVERALQAADDGLDQVLAGLAAAAASGTVVAVMTYYDPVPACRLAPLAPLSARVLEGQDGVPGLNDLVRARAAQHGAVVVETADRLSLPADVVGGDDCLHPSASGHRVLAAAFAEALGADR